jgi:hypothetical protein
MSTEQEDYRTCAAVVALGAANLERAEAFRRKARAEFRALLRAGKVKEIIVPPYREPHPVTAEVQARFYELRRSGKSLRQVAALTGFSPTSIVRYTPHWRIAA